jgi:dUTPase
VRAEFVEVDTLPESVRAGGGFGSTGGWADHGADPPGRS